MSTHVRASQVALVIKNPPANAGDIRDAGSIPELRRSPGGGQPITVFLPVWSEDPGQLQSMGLQRVRHDWSDVACMQARIHTCIFKLLSCFVEKPGLEEPLIRKSYGNFTLVEMQIMDLMLFLAKQALLSEGMMAFEIWVMSEGTWNAGKGKGLEQTPGLHRVLDVSLPLSHVVPGRAAFLLAFYSLTALKFPFFFFGNFWLSFSPTLLLSCDLCSFSLSPHLFLSPFPSSLWKVGCLFIYFSNSSQNKPQNPLG